MVTAGERLLQGDVCLVDWLVLLDQTHSEPVMM